MNTVLLRTLGFAAPTFIVVMSLHLAKLATPGEALDGAVSAAWFVAFFSIGAWIAERIGFSRRSASAGSLLWSGAAAGLFAWLFLWAFWAVPFTTGLRLQPSIVFTINTLAMVVAALVAARIPVARAGTELAGG